MYQVRLLEMEDEEDEAAMKVLASLFYFCLLTFRTVLQRPEYPNVITPSSPPMHTLIQNRQKD